MAATTPDVLQSARALSDQIQEAMTLAEALETAGSDWPSQLRIKCRQPSFASERAALKALFGDPHRESEADAPLDAGTQRSVSSDA